MRSLQLPAVPGFDEMIAPGGEVRPHYTSYHDWLLRQDRSLLLRKRKEAELQFHRVGITFNVYGEESGTERLIPFDTLPRVLPASEWSLLERGAIQRVQALNLFLHDIYHDQNIIRDGRIPAEQIFGNAQYQPCMQDVDLPNQVYSQISGVDLIRDGEGSWFVLEDNLRTPSGVSYMIENRRMMMRLFPELFAGQSVAPVEHYPALLLETLQQSATHSHPCVV